MMITQKNTSIFIYYEYHKAWKMKERKEERIQKIEIKKKKEKISERKKKEM